MAPLMPSEDPNSPKTRLLTLLNVSATRSNKKRRLDALLEPEESGPRKKLNARKVVVQEENGDGKEEEGSGEESEEDEAEDAGAEIIASEDADPAYTSHFGPAPSILTDATRTSTLERTWTTTTQSYGALGQFASSIPAASTYQSSSITNEDETAAAARLHTRLRPTWSTHLSNLPPKSRAQHSSALGLLASRKDIYHPHLAGNPKLHEAWRRSVAAHGLDHVLKKSDLVLSNNRKVKAREEKAKKSTKGKKDAATEGSADAAKEKEDVVEVEDIEPDQGFTRPALLILTPFRSQALQWLSALSSSLPGKIEGEDRYKREYGLPEGASDKLRDAPKGTYAEDHVEILSGNVDDSFRLGLRLTKRGMKSYTEFYSSDILIASPLGLRLAIEKNKNHDFLSSIEIAVIDQADVMRMQNWEHVQFVMSHLNELPKESHETDFGRVKPWYLDGHAAHLRQTILLSRHETPEMRALYNKVLKNVAGKIRALKRYSAVRVPEGVDTQFLSLPPASSTSPVSEPDARFNFVTTQVLPVMLKSAVQSANACIVVPDSLDFVRVQNWFRKQELSHATLSEYATGPEISRARQTFFTGKKSWLVVSERFWFYHRYTLRGIRHLLFYAPPAHPQCYSEFVAYPFADKDVQSEDVTVRVVTGRLDALALERIVGSKAVGGLVAGAR